MTVEAAFIMPFVIMMSILLIFMMIYLYDCCVLSDAVLHGALEYSFCIGESNGLIKRKTNDKIKTHIDEMSVMSQDVDITVFVNSLKVKTEAEASIDIPILSENFEDFAEIGVSWDLPRISGGQVLRDTRRIIGIKDAANKVKEDYFYGDVLQEGSQPQLPDNAN